MHPHNAAKSMLLAFLLCGVADFVWGYIHGRSIVTGVIWVVLGMFGTAGYFNSEALGSPFRRKIPTSPIDPGFREQTAQACANA
jgi:hypothetical protein